MNAEAAALYPVGTTNAGKIVAVGSTSSKKTSDDFTLTRVALSCYKVRLILGAVAGPFVGLFINLPSGVTSALNAEPQLMTRLTGLGLAFLMEMRDTSMRTERDVEFVLRLPVLAMVPEIAPLTAKSDGQLGVLKDARSGLGLGSGA